MSVEEISGKFCGQKPKLFKYRYFSVKMTIGGQVSVGIVKKLSVLISNRAIWRGNAGTGSAIPEPSNANIAQIPFWIENIDPELVTFGRLPCRSINGPA